MQLEVWRFEPTGEVFAVNYDVQEPAAFGPLSTEQVDAFIADPHSLDDEVRFRVEELGTFDHEWSLIWAFNVA